MQDYCLSRGLGNVYKRQALRSIIRTASRGRSLAFGMAMMSGGVYGYAQAFPAVAVIALAAGGGFAAKGLISYGIQPKFRKRGQAALMNVFDEAIKVSQGDRRLIRKLRADRVAILEVLDTAEERWNSGGEQLFYEQNPEMIGKEEEIQQLYRRHI